MSGNNVLVRPHEGRVVAGVCMGMANYSGLDVLVVRFLWLVFMGAGGARVLCYFLCWFFIPSEPAEVVLPKS